MRRLLLLLALLAPAAFAQTPLRVQFIYNADANAYWQGPTNAAAAINAAMGEVAQSFASSLIQGTPVLAGITAGEAVPLIASGAYGQLIPSTYNIGIADIAQVNNADVIVMVVQHPFPNSAAGGSWKGDPFVDAINSVIVIDANVLADQTTLLYWLGRQMGAKNQRAGGLGNETVGTAHGWWIKFGNSTSNCETAVTLDTDKTIIQDFAGTCAGWREIWKSTTGVLHPTGPYFDPGYLECSAQGYCTADATEWVPTLPNSTWSLAPSLYRNWRGVLGNAGNGGTQSCSALADRDVLAGGGVLDTGPQTMGTPVTGNYGFLCQNMTFLNVFSSPLLSYKGQPLGDANNNSVATINANIAIKANTHNMERRKLIAAALGN